MNDTKCNTKGTRNKRTQSDNSTFSLVANILFIIILFIFIVFNSDNMFKIGEKDNGNKEVTSAYSSTETNGGQSRTAVIKPDTDTLPLEIHEFAVSCANAQMIRYDGVTVFIDGGATFTYEKMIEQMELLGVRSIDYYVATHWHSDHISNMQKLLKTFGHERTIVYGPSTQPDESYRVANGTYEQLLVGGQFNIGDVRFTCVGPYKVKEAGKTNPDSLNIVIEYGDFKAMITGDYVYNRAIEDYPELTRDLDVLQMPHHGLRNFCISNASMSHCNPKTVLVPAEKSDATASLIKELRIDARVLDNQNGHICIITYGEGYQVFTNVISTKDLY